MVEKVPFHLSRKDQIQVVIFFYLSMSKNSEMLNCQSNAVMKRQ